jgi:hypothetical protein
MLMGRKGPGRANPLIALAVKTLKRAIYLFIII